MEEQIEFDFNEILNQFRNGKKLTGKDGLLAPLIKQRDSCLHLKQK